MVLIKKIGKAEHCTPVAVLLSDPDNHCMFVAADTLSSIGDENALLALDVWLANGNHRDDKELRKIIRECRDQLKERLAKEKQ